jgi:uncharacterized protein (TIGR00251 family)
MIPIWVQPNAKKTEVMGLYADYVKIKLHAPAVDNKANDCLILFLSDSFKTAKSNIMLIKGQHQRKKKLQIQQATYLPDWALPFINTP